MSIDSRLREAMRTEDPGWRAGAETSYDAVVVGARRRTVARRTAVGGAVAVAALIAGFALAPGSDSGPDPAPAPSVPITNDDHPGSTGLPFPSGPLDGAWRTGPITRATIAQTLRDAGLDHYAEDYAATFPEGRFRLTLRVFAGQAVLRADSELRTAASVEIEGSRLVMRPGQSGHGHTVFDWATGSDRLQMELVRCSLAGYSGFPGIVHQTALFTSSPFIRY